MIVDRHNDYQWFVTFYKQECEHAIELKAPISHAQAEMQQRGTPNGRGVVFAAVDMDQNPGLVEQHQIGVSPTLLMFKSSGEVEEYLGDRNPQSLVNFSLTAFDELLKNEVGLDTPPVLANPAWERYLDVDYDNGDIIILGDDNYDRVVYNSPEMWIVVFTAENCKFCKQFDLIYERIGAELAGQIRFAYVDALKNKALTKRFGLT
jgi:Thioredoxin domain-containing protein